jgi:hypothetical protein
MLSTIKKSQHIVLSRSTSFCFLERGDNSNKRQLDLVINGMWVMVNPFVLRGYLVC